MESDRGSELYNSIFQDFSSKNNIKIYSGNTSLGAVFAEGFNRSIRGLLKDQFLKRVMEIGLMYYPK